jgi:hypothetical protein
LNHGSVPATEECCQRDGLGRVQGYQPGDVAPLARTTLARELLQYGWHLRLVKDDEAQGAVSGGSYDFLELEQALLIRYRRDDVSQGDALGEEGDVIDTEASLSHGNGPQVLVFLCWIGLNAAILAAALGRVLLLDDLLALRGEGLLNFGCLR